MTQRCLAIPWPKNTASWKPGWDFPVKKSVDLSYKAFSLPGYRTIGSSNCSKSFAQMPPGKLCAIIRMSEGMPDINGTVSWLVRDGDIPFIRQVSPKQSEAPVPRKRKT